jgi:hypothetical protein
LRDRQKYEGLFFPSEIQGTGHVKLGNNNARVSLVGDLYGFLNEDSFDIHGRLSDGRQLSLIDCIRTGSTEFHGDEQRSVETNVYPHFAVVGKETISSNDAKIKKLTYQCEQAHLFCAYADTFGIMNPSSEALNTLMDADHERLEKSLTDHDVKPKRRKKALGEDPPIAFFDGNYEIAEVKTPHGKISVWNGISYRPGGAKGVKIKNTVLNTIEFHEPQELRKAVHDLQSIHQFYELLLGCRQRYKKIQLTLEGMDEAQCPPIRLLWNRCNRRVNKRHRDVHPTDIPILASIERELFESVLKNWMSTSPSMEASRFRLFNGLLSNTYSYDRIVGAANMYDLLPGERVPTRDELSPELSGAVDSARGAFKDLEQSSARDSVLSSLGRIGKPSLKSKLLYRADIVNKAMAIRFQKLNLVCHHAVLCRNHYVHGSEPGFNYDENFSCFAFLTDTLEFIFAASDLIDCGWNSQEYISRHGTMSHFISHYIINYELNLKELEKAIQKRD